jgi:hypothetical protein
MFEFSWGGVDSPLNYAASTAATSASFADSGTFLLFIDKYGHYSA